MDRASSVRLGIIPFTADRSLLRPAEMFFMFDDAEVQVQDIHGNVHLGSSYVARQSS
jgi:hypothetical protein